MKKLLAFTALAEAATGLALILAPSFVGQCLFGTGLSGVARVMGLLTGIALLGLAVACCPGCSALWGMLTYSALVAAGLSWLGVGGDWVGPALWPAVAAHTVLALLLAWACLVGRR